MWTLALTLLIGGGYALHYVCSSSTVHYYSPVAYPLPSTTLRKTPQCYRECAPCVWSKTHQVMVGYRAYCHPTIEQQLKYQLMNQTHRLNNMFLTKPTVGISHSYRALPFIHHGYLCVYPETDLEDDDIHTIEVNPKPFFHVPL